MNRSTMSGAAAPAGRKPLRRATRTSLATLATLAVFILLDAMWLGLLARQFYLDAIGHLMATDPHLAAAALFYLLFPLVLAWYAFVEAPDRDNAWSVASRGARFGLVTYGTYGLTNWATLRDWPGTLVLVDVGWGTLLSAIAATAASVAWQLLRPR
ncbi:MAG: DUF2177 family protein [Burkholderiales bacterium]|nr:DUF2177 family protein [Burkholderiales bacterium]